MRPLSLLLLAACARGTSFTPDAAPGTDGGREAGDDKDAAQEDSSPVSIASALLVTEVMLAPTTGEFIEIANPTALSVALEHYYLSDSGNYFRVPNTATVDQTDFIVKFPAGATIGARSVITVALDTAANFQAVHAMPPTYSIAGGTMTPVATNGTAQLTNNGELVVLFYWDGADRVADSDLVLAGAPTAGNGLNDKSGIVMDGPDADTMGTAYATDARTITGQGGAPSSGVSTKRTQPELGNEVQVGAGNGVEGDDETSENTAVTWDATYTTATPGVVPASVLP